MVMGGPMLFLEPIIRQLLVPVAGSVINAGSIIKGISGILCGL